MASLKAFSTLITTWLLFTAHLRVVYSLSRGENKYQELDVTFCQKMKTIRGIFNTAEGLDYVFKDELYVNLRRVQLRRNFMSDYFTWQEYGQQVHMNGVYSTGVFIEHLNMLLMISISQVQINGDFANRDDTFDLTYTLYWDDYLQHYGGVAYSFFYESPCYIHSCLQALQNFYRAFRLHFCRDTYATYRFPLNDPCYLYTGPNTTLDMYCNGSSYLHDRKVYKSEIKWHCARHSDYDTADSSDAKLDFCGHKKDAKPVLNSLFPYSFSASSRGGLFRSMVFYQGKFFWIENSPTFQYRYLAQLTDPMGNYSDKWQSSSVEPKELTQQFYFASAFVYPRLGNEIDRVYFLLLPKNFTINTEAKYRRAKSMLPLVLEEKNYTLDEIIGINCTKWMAKYIPEASSNGQIFAATLVIFLIIFLALITLLTADLGGKGAKTRSQEDHTQSKLLEKLRK